jgi:hypothetical protein
MNKRIANDAGQLFGDHITWFEGDKRLCCGAMDAGVSDDLIWERFERFRVRTDNTRFVREPLTDQEGDCHVIYGAAA